MLTEDALLIGAFDLHAHVYPEFTLGMPPRLGNLAWADLAEAAGMRGYVLKSHVWPTTATAYTVREHNPNLEVLGSITCNVTTGGLSPISVEIAVEAGARIVWMPTFSAPRHTGAPSAFAERMRPWITTIDSDADSIGSLSVLGDDGALTREVLEIIGICRRRGAALATGHLPIAESLALAEEAEARGVRIVLTHPFNASVAASIEEQKAFAAHGGFIEHTFITAMPMHHRLDPRRIAEAIHAVGPEHCVMATDTIEAWNPPAPEVMRMFIASMLALGVDQGAVRTMTHENPCHVVGIERQ